jgi:hypothetical protein
MVPSSTLCRAQETLHRHRAANTTLENVRLVATSAAAAWAKEATAAESREARQLRAHAAASAHEALKRAPADNDLLPSENPDRGLAHL